jgi:hypothetical protein
MRQEPFPESNFYQLRYPQNRTARNVRILL